MTGFVARMMHARTLAELQDIYLEWEQYSAARPRCQCCGQPLPSREGVEKLLPNPVVPAVKGK